MKKRTGGEAMEGGQPSDRRVRLSVWIIVAICFLGGCAALLSLAGVVLEGREESRRGRCEYNLAQIYRATCEYSDSYGVYPPAFTTDSDGEKLHSWRVLLLPYLGEEELYARIRLDEPWNSEWNSQFWSLSPEVFCCASMPSRDGDGYRAATPTERCAVSCALGDDSVFPADGASIAPESVVDGASNTIMYLERKSPVNWMNPGCELTTARILSENVAPYGDRRDFGSWHGAGDLVLLCDGSTRFLSEKIDNSVLALLLSKDDSARESEENSETYNVAPTDEASSSSD